MLGTVGYYGTYGFVIYRTVAGALTLGTMTILVGAIAGASANIQAFFSTFSIIADQALFMNDLLEFFSVQPKIFSKPGALPAPRPIRQGFEFKNVSFHYPDNPRLVLNNVSFKLEPSSRIALVGENGQGKTTIVKLLTRLYDPTAGQILLDGIDLREYDLDDLRREIGVIFQDFTRYEMTAVGEYRRGPDRRLPQYFPHPLRRQEEPRGEGDSQAAQGLRPNAGLPLRRRRRSFRRRMAEDGAGAGLPARRASADPR